MAPSYVAAIRELGAADDAIDAVLSRVSFGVFVDHVEKGCIYANAEVLRMFETDWETFRGFGWANAVLPEDMETLREAIERYEKEKTWIEVQYRIKVPDGSLRAIHVVGKAILDNAGEQRGSVMIGREVTSERAVRDQTIQRQKLEAIGRLSSRIAHDFNNVLTPIMMSSSLLEAEVISEDGRTLLDTITKGVEHAASITRQLLGLSRHSVGERRSTTIDEEIRAMAALLRQLLGETYELALDLDAADAEVGLAPQELAQVILNLAVNARDAMSNSGTVSIATQLRDSFAEISVSDTGSGISEGVRQHMFEPFFTTKSADRGTGLGLFTVRDLVESAGGRIDVRSEVDKGTTIAFRLPCVGFREVTAPLSAIPSDHGSLRILVVEDNSALRQTLAYVLALRRHHVKTSANIGRAKALLDAEEFDVLVTDVLLPDGTGPTLVQHARGLMPSLAIVYMTGFAGDAQEMLDLDDANTTMLEKPFHPNRLAEALAKVMANQQ